MYNFDYTICNYRCVVYVLKEKKQLNLFQDLIHFLKRIRQCIIKLRSRDIRNQCFIWTIIMLLERYYPAF